MWSRGDLKSQAKGFLKKHYWKAFAVCLIVALVTGGSGESSKNNDYTSNDFGKTRYEINFGPGNEFGTIVDGIGLDNPFKVAVSGAMFAGFFIMTTILAIVIGNALQVGEKRFFLRGFKEEPSIGTLFTTFQKGEWGPIAIKMFLMDVFIFLWGLLLIIPGIIKYYQYRMIPYILAEDPEFSFEEVKQISTKMTGGQKSDIFILDLSFIGWYILGALFFGIGGIFVKPYHEATVAKLYQLYRNGMELTVREQFGGSAEMEI
jgi:uncharacterized membrane protein